MRNCVNKLFGLRGVANKHIQPASADLCTPSASDYWRSAPPSFPLPTVGRAVSVSFLDTADDHPLTPSIFIT
jgi:hypothetical protein